MPKENQSLQKVKFWGLVSLSEHKLGELALGPDVEGRVCARAAAAVEIQQVEVIELQVLWAVLHQ